MDIFVCFFKIFIWLFKLFSAEVLSTVNYFILPEYRSQHDFKNISNDYI